MSIILKRMPKVEDSFSRLTTRLEMGFTASPFYAFAAIGFIVLLSIFTSLEINPRVQSIGKPIEFTGQESADAKLWISIAPQGEKIVLKGNDGRSFSWSLNGPSPIQRQDFEVYLRSRVHEIIQDSMLSDRMDSSTVRAVISLDEKLNFNHLRPIIYALASARITHYAFEGRIVK